MTNSVVNKRCLKTCCAHKARRSSTVVDKPRDAWSSVEHFVYRQCSLCLWSV